MKFRCLIVIFILAVFTLSSCSFLKDTKDAVLKFDENSYKPIINWEMIKGDNYTVGKGIWQGDEHTIRLFKDSENRFIFDEYFQLLYHKEIDILPNYKNVESIENIEIVYSDPNKTRKVIDDKIIIENIIELMSQPFDKEVFKNNSPFSKTIAAIDVYYKGYPAFQSAVSVIQAQDGSYGFVIRDWYGTAKQGNRNYIKVMPDNSITAYFK